MSNLGQAGKQCVRQPPWFAARERYHVVGLSTLRSFLLKMDGLLFVQSRKGYLGSYVVHGFVPR
jgi:hypothetical protein